MSIKFFCVETQRCLHIFEERDRISASSSDVELSNQGADIVVSVEDEWLLEINPNNLWEDFFNGGEVQGQQSTTSTTRTQSRATHIPTSNSASGVGALEHPADGQGIPLIPVHNRDHQGEADGQDGLASDDVFEDIPLNSLEEAVDGTDDSIKDVPLNSPEVSDDGTDDSNENSRCVTTGVTCSCCEGQPQTVQVFFSAEVSDDVWKVICVYCSEECAQSRTAGNQVVICVNLWNTETSSWRPCASCLRFRSMPVTVCRNCQAYICGICSIRCKQIRGYYKCPHQCPGSNGIITVVLPACIAGPAQLKRVELEPSVPTDQSGEERAVAGVIQRMSQEEQLMRHRRQQLDDESRRLEEANYFQDLFVSEESSGNLISSHLLDDSDLGGMTSGPPTEEFQPPTVEGGVEEECDDPVAEEDLLEEQPQEVPTILPAPKESEREVEDEGIDSTE